MWLSFLKNKPNSKICQSCFYFSFLLLGLKCWFITSLSCYKLSIYLSPTLHNLPLSYGIIIQQLYIAVQKTNFVNFFKIIIWKQVCFNVKEHDAVICSLLRLEIWSSAVAFNLPTFFLIKKTTLLLISYSFKNSSSLWYSYIHLQQGPYNQIILIHLVFAMWK